MMRLKAYELCAVLGLLMIIGCSKDSRSNVQTSSSSQQSAASAKQVIAQLFLLESPEDMQWCAYTNRTEWQNDVDKILASSVAIAKFSAGSLSEVQYTQQAESGDWTVYDSYEFSKGNLTGLTRIANILPGDRSVTQKFSFGNTGPVLISSTYKTLSNGKLASRSDVEVPNLPIANGLTEFPFYSLISSGNLPVGKKCSPAAKK